MCEICTKKKNISVYRAAASYDPTRTTTLRNAFAREMRKRFTALRGEIRHALIEQDILGFKTQTYSGIQVSQFSFPLSSEKIKLFNNWLRQKEETHIFSQRQSVQIGVGYDPAWTNRYVEDSYRRGVARGRYEMSKAGYNVPTIEDTGGMGATMGAGYHVDRLGLVATRAYEELKGITAQMNSQITRVLTQGMADGDGPRLLARKLNAVISGSGSGSLGITDTLGRYIPAQRRAEMLARTEIIRSHHVATIQEYRNWAVVGVTVKAEWRTAGDERVCADCAGLESSVFTLDEIEKLIPLHPNCRCLALPLRVETAPKPQPIVAPQSDVSRMLSRTAAGRARYREMRNAIKNDPVARTMARRDSVRYLKYQDEYTEFWKDFSKKDLKLLSKGPGYMTQAETLRLEEISKTIGKKYFMDMDNAWTAARSWQGSTHGSAPMALKKTAMIVDKNTGVMYVPKGWTAESLSELAAIDRKELLRMRAFSQTYMKYTKQRKNIEMYRGTGGSHGAELSKKIADMRGYKPDSARTNITDAPLVGYTTDINVARDFGIHDRGITVTIQRMPYQDVVLHTDLLRGITRQYWREVEYILIGRKRSISLKNIETADGWY